MFTIVLILAIRISNIIGETIIDCWQSGGIGISKVGYLNGCRLIGEYSQPVAHSMPGQINQNIYFIPVYLF